MEISKKQELAKQLSDQIKELETDVHPSAKPKWRKLGIVIQNYLNASDEQKILNKNIEEINHAFFDNLTKQFPSLSKSDLELCSFIRLGLSNKEIASLRKVTPEAIRSGRFRLRKKLQVVSKEEVEKFLQQLGGSNK